VDRQVPPPLVRANADQPDQAELATRSVPVASVSAARNICSSARLHRSCNAILADNEADRRAALNELLPMQREDFYGVFKGMKDAGHDPHDRSAPARIPAQA
jgi:pyruvate,orthophosphate dikinase